MPTTTAAAQQQAPMMLDGGDGASTRWVNDDIDALPYADTLPENWRAGVDQLINEEMRRMSKRPKDYLAEMAPAHELNFKGCPLLEKEFKRVVEGKGAMPPPDSTRYELAPPPKSKRGDENAWLVAVANARAQLEHQGLRIQNLELASKFAPNAWRAHNASLEAAIMTYERQLKGVRAEIAEVNLKRSLQQSTELDKLEAEWYATSIKCVAIDGAVQGLEQQLEEIRAAAGK